MIFSLTFPRSKMSHQNYYFHTLPKEMSCHIQIVYELFDQRTLTVGGMVTVQFVSSLTRFDLTKEESVMLFVCT